MLIHKWVFGIKLSFSSLYKKNNNFLFHESLFHIYFIIWNILPQLQKNSKDVLVTKIESDISVLLLRTYVEQTINWKYVICNQMLFTKRELKLDWTLSSYCQEYQALTCETLDLQWYKCWETRVFANVPFTIWNLSSQYIDVPSSIS